MNRWPLSARSIVLGTVLSSTALMTLAGCASNRGSNRSTSAPVEYQPTAEELAEMAAAAERAALDPSMNTPEALAAAVEERYVIGPAAAATLGYRIDWQHPSHGSRIKLVSMAGDSVFTLDDRNMLTRIRHEDNSRVWRIPVGAPVLRVLGVNYVPSTDAVYLLTGGEVIVLDAASGARVTKQKLDKVANTAPIVVGPYLIYGSRDGQVVWHSYLTSSDWAGYQVSQSIQVAPVFADGYLVAVGNDGRIMSIRADSASQIWNRLALDDVVARPTAGNGAVYVASMDQHLRAFELGENRSPRWEYLTESPLSESPVLIGDRVYQHVPSDGLVCLEALPLDRPGGVIIWESPEVTGNVITRHRNNVITWDNDSKMLVTVDINHGAIVESAHMPQIESLIATSTNRGTLYVTSTDGRIARLVPRR